MEASLSKAGLPWQLQMFRFALKKQLKLQALLNQLGNVFDQDCLLVTCGDNNGALNWHFRSQGGNWTWGEVMEESLVLMSDFLGEKVYHLSGNQFPFEDNHFDCVVAIDVLEHLADDQPFLRELNRVLRPGGKAIVTVPNGDNQLLANRIKWRLGMTPEVYGHTRAGYTHAQLKDALSRIGLKPISESGYSRFFTEMVELMINFGYVFVLSRKNDNKESGQIAPTSESELKIHGSAYRLYSLAFPFLRLISKLDNLLSTKSDNAVIVQAIKPQRYAA
jgi:SAM-dependent methyltransferase